MSVMEILVELYFRQMNISPENVDDPDRDRFVLSKGHGALAYYITLAQAGLLPEEFLHTFETRDSILPAHPCQHREYGIEFSTGSLGHGLSLGLGLALQQKRSGLGAQTYVILGDGENNEGSIWEAAMMAAHYHVDNLTAMIDCNRLQSDGFCRDVQAGHDLPAMWSAAGWEAVEVDGHDAGQLLDALHERSRPNGRPRAIIAHTIKGKGVSFMENNNAWHHRSISQEQHDAAAAELLKAAGKEA